MVKRIYLDIETLPPNEEDRRTITQATLRQLERRRRCGDVHERDGRECSDKEFKRMALFGEYGRVACIGVIIEIDGVETLRGVFGRDRLTGQFHLDEARTLRSFWKFMHGFDLRRDLVIGHNIMDFDLPFLYKRSMINRVPATVRLSFARYRSAPIYDTMREWSHWDCKRYISLNDLARVLKIDMEKTEGMNGGLVYERFCAGCHTEIADYCLQDVEITRAIYRCMCYEPELLTVNSP
jgi:hypothetical protein